METTVNSNIIAITLDNFQQVIAEQSKEKLILVAFWAEQIPESIELRDKLTTKTANFTEHMIMATVDCQTQSQIAQQFGIQGLPTAILVKDGQPLDGVSGPQTDENIAEFLDKHLPSQQDILLEKAKKSLTEHNISAAQTAISQAYQLELDQGGSRADIKLTLANVYIQTGKYEDAQALLNSIMMIDQDSEYQGLIAKLELATQAANSPEIQSLEAQYKKNSTDINLVHQLAAQYSQVNRHEDALTLLFRLVQSGASDAENTKEKSKELLLGVLKSLPDGDPLATKYRRKLYTLLY